MAEIRLPAERKYQAELAALAAADTASKPPGWVLSPRAVETYVMGAAAPIGGVIITPKYVGDRALVQPCDLANKEQVTIRQSRNDG